MRLGNRSVFDRLYHAGNWVVRIVGSAIFLALGWYSMRFTYHMEPGQGEMPILVPDSMWKNMFVLFVALAVLSALLIMEQRTDRKVQMLLKRATLCVAMLWTGGASAWWIQVADRVPEGDQAYVYGGASQFLEGDFGFLNKGAYMGMHPHQLALVALCELLFVFVGTYNYLAIEVICGIMAVGIVYLGYRLVSEITDRMAVVVGYNLLMLGCLPLIFYTSWCYGDVPSIFCSLIAAWMLMRYAKQGKWGDLVIMVAAMTFALMFRKHTLILLVAMCIAAVLYSLKKRDLRIVAAALLAVVMFEASYQGIYKMYEVRSGIEHEEGIPFVAWIAMGMQDTQYHYYGWFNNYPKAIYGQVDGDAQKVVEASLQNLRERFATFRSDPGYAKVFFREKILSQWNQPLYQSVYFNTKYLEGLQPGPNSFASKVSGIYFEHILNFCDRWQFVVFIGMLCYFLFAVRKDSNVLQHVLAITMIGGFFFSIVYEAKARYIFPYYVTMFPFAVYGYQQMLERVTSLLGRGRVDQAQTDAEAYEDEKTA